MSEISPYETSDIGGVDQVNQYSDRIKKLSEILLSQAQVYDIGEVNDFNCRINVRSTEFIVGPDKYILSSFYRNEISSNNNELLQIRLTSILLAENQDERYDYFIHFFDPQTGVLDVVAFSDLTPEVLRNYKQIGLLVSYEREKNSSVGGFDDFEMAIDTLESMLATN